MSNFQHCLLAVLMATAAGTFHGSHLAADEKTTPAEKSDGATPPKEPAKADATDKDGWRALFNGKDLEGWKVTNFGGEGEIRTLKAADWAGGHVMPTGDALLSGYYLNELVLRRPL